MTDGSTAETTLYAVWTSDNPCMIFDAAGGKLVFEDGTEKEKVTIPFADIKDSYDATTIGQFIQTKKDELKAVVKKDHNQFDNWSICVPSEVFETLSEGIDYTFTANWIPAKAITFVTNGGTELPVYEFFEEKVTPQLFYWDDSYLITKADYIFAGWFLDEDLTTPSEDYIYESKTLYAKWVKKDYEVTQSNLTETLKTLSDAISYKKNVVSIGKNITEARFNSETYNLKYTGIITKTEIDALKEAFHGFNYRDAIYVNLDLSEATGLTSIPDKAFFGCNALRKVQLSDEITSIESSAFADCWHLYTIVLPSNLSEMDSSVFKWCSALTSIKLPASLTKIPSECFSECTALTSITIPENISEIAALAFNKCEALNSVTFENKSSWKIKNADDADFHAIPEPLDDPDQNATLLKTKYVSYDWKR